jgi:hypothetical protein
MRPYTFLLMPSVRSLLLLEFVLAGVLGHSILGKMKAILTHIGAWGANG